MSDSDSDSGIDEFMGGSDSDDESIGDESILYEVGSSADDSDAQSFDSDTSLSHLSADEEERHVDYSVEETDFDQEEDAEAFAGVSRYHYRQVILPLKVCSEHKHFSYTFHSDLKDSGKTRLGSFIQSATRLKHFHVTFKEEQPQSVGHIFRGPSFQQDHALRRFKIKGSDDSGHVRISLDDWGCISGYLGKAPLLRNLHLEDVHLGREELVFLSSALERTKLKTLHLIGLQIGDDEDESLGILFTSMNVTELETIDVVSCGAGVNACQGLANILCNEESELDRLNLDCNAIDDKCVEVLCQSISGNTSLEEIHVNGNGDITDGGWTLFEKLVFDQSSLERIYRSNHTLHVVSGHPRPQIFTLISSKKGHEKILDFLMYSEDFNMEPFVEYKVEMLPHVLGFFGARIDRNSIQGAYSPWYYLYQIIRRWNMPELFSFPSAEKVRLTARLTTKMDELKREMELLKLANARLSSENELLISGVHPSGKGNQSPKRKRFN